MGGDGEIDTWRRDQLSDEPLYCSAPTPIDPDDIICYGSDEDLDNASKIAKRLRYEEQGLKYLRGKPIRLISATLRGPFEKASGWKNPWLPKTPVKILNQSKIPTHPMKVAPAVKKSFLRLCAVTDNASPTTHTSMECQLPSPESNRGVEAGHDYLDTERHDRIQAWARNVATVPLTKDQFWAPDTEVAEGSDITRKRQAAEEWLRTKPPKRNRLNTTQGTASASTPTPLPAPTSFNHDKPSSRTRSSQRRTDLSFELTTPSSTADRIPAKPTAPPPTSNYCVNNAMQSKDGSSSADAATPSSASPSASNASSIEQALQPGITTACDQPTSSVRIQDPCEQQRNGTTEHHTTAEAESRDATSERGDNSDADDPRDTTMKSFADASFHYHVRPPKPEASAEDAPNTQERHSSLPARQTTTSDLRDHHAENAQPTNNTEKKYPMPVETTESPDDAAESTGSDGAASGGKKDDAFEAQPDTHDDAEINTMPGLSKSQGSFSLVGDTSDLNPTNPTSEMVIRGEPPSGIQEPETMDNGENIRTSFTTRSLLKRQHDDTEENVPTETPELQLKKMRIEEPEEFENTANAIRADDMGLCHADRETGVNRQVTPVGNEVDGTLVEHSMDIDKPLEPAQPRELAQPANPTNVEGGKVCEEPPAAARSPSGNLDEMLEDESEIESRAESEGIVLPLSQQEWGISDDKEVPVSKDCSTVPAETIPIKVGRPQDSVYNSPAAPGALPELNQSRAPQTPWASQHDALNGPLVERQPMDEDTKSPMPSSADATPLRPRRDLQSPGIRASQQSPWVREVTLPTTKSREQNFKMDIKFMIESVPSPQGEQQSLHDKENLPVAPCGPYPTDDTNRIPTTDRHNEEVIKIPNQGSEEYRPASRNTRPHTPEPEVLLKSFATFNTPSPMRRSSYTRSRKSTGRRSGILVNHTPSNPWSSAKSSNRRVSFAALPGQEDEMQDEATEPLVRRATSPPPETTIDTEEEDVNDAFRKHFDAVKKRSNKQPGPHFQQQLLPRPSQEKPSSLVDSARVDTLHTADAVVTVNQDTAAGDQQTAPEEPEPEPELETRGTDMEVDAEDGDSPQSPWRSQGTTQQVDDVAAVLGNLDQFLDAWDVDTALDQAATAPVSEVDALQGISVWD